MRLTAFILAIFYLGFAIGATVHQHYCMGELVGNSLFSSQDSPCVKCGMESHGKENDNCCKDVSLLLKTGDSHIYSQVYYDFNFSLADISSFSPESSTISVYKRFAYPVCKAHSPPLLNTSIIIRQHGFRI